MGKLNEAEFWQKLTIYVKITADFIARRMHASSDNFYAKKNAMQQILLTIMKNPILIWKN